MKEESRTKSSLKNVSFSLITQVSTILLNYICRYIFVKVLSQEYLGINGLFTNILTLFSLAELGIGSAIVYAMYKPISEKNENKIKCYMNFYKKCYTVIAIIVFVIGLLILPNLNFFIKDTPNIKGLNFIYLLYLLDSVFSYLFVYKASILNAMQKNYICNYYQIICKIAMTILMSVSLLLFKNFVIYLLIQISFKLINNILISKKADKLYPYIKDTKKCDLVKTEKKQIYKNVYALFCNQIGNVLINGTDNIIISKYVNLVSVGFYSNYYLVISSLSNFIGQIFNSIVASVGNLAASTDKNKTYELFNKVNFINFLTSSFCVLMTTNCIKPFIELSFGKDYLLDNFTVIIILINFYLLTMKNSVGTFKFAMGIFWNDKYCTLIRAVINVISSVILVKLYGLPGVFIGTLLSDVVTTLWYQPYVLFKNGFILSPWRYFKDFFIYSTCTILEIFLSAIIINKMNINNLFVHLIVSIVISFIIYLIVTIILFRKNVNFRFVMKTVSNIFIKIKNKFIHSK